VRHPRPLFATSDFSSVGIIVSKSPTHNSRPATNTTGYRPYRLHTSLPTLRWIPFPHQTAFAATCPYHSRYSRNLSNHPAPNILSPHNETHSPHIRLSQILFGHLTNIPFNALPRICACGGSHQGFNGRGTPCLGCHSTSSTSATPRLLLLYHLGTHISLGVSTLRTY